VPCIHECKKKKKRCDWLNSGKIDNWQLWYILKLPASVGEYFKISNVKLSFPHYNIQVIFLWIFEAMVMLLRYIMCWCNSHQTWLYGPYLLLLNQNESCLKWMYSHMDVQWFFVKNWNTIRVWGISFNTEHLYVIYRGFIYIYNLIRPDVSVMSVKQVSICFDVPLHVVHIVLAQSIWNLQHGHSISQPVHM